MASLNDKFRVGYVNYLKTPDGSEIMTGNDYLDQAGNKLDLDGMERVTPKYYADLDGNEYAVSDSAMPEFAENNVREGRKVMPMVEMVHDKGPSMRVNAYDQERINYMKANGWRDKLDAEPGLKEILADKQTWDWYKDPENLKTLPEKMLRGGGAALAEGLNKGIATVGNLALTGGAFVADHLGARSVAASLRQLGRNLHELSAQWSESIYGRYLGEDFADTDRAKELAKKAIGGIGELGGIYALGGPTRLGGGILGKLGLSARAAETATMAGLFGMQGFEKQLADQEAQGKEAYTARSVAAATFAGATQAFTGALYGKLYGLIGREEAGRAIRETYGKMMGRAILDTFEGGVLGATNAAADAEAKAIVGDDVDWEKVPREMLTNFFVGSATVAMTKIPTALGLEIRKARERYADAVMRQGMQALAADRAGMPLAANSASLPDVRGTTVNGEVVFQDGTIFRARSVKLPDGTHTGGELITADGTILSAQGKVLGKTADRLQYLAAARGEAKTAAEYVYRSIDADAATKWRMIDRETGLATDGSIASLERAPESVKRWRAWNEGGRKGEAPKLDAEGIAFVSLHNEAASELKGMSRAAQVALEGVAEGRIASFAEAAELVDNAYRATEGGVRSIYGKFAKQQAPGSADGGAMKDNVVLLPMEGRYAPKAEEMRQGGALPEAVVDNAKDIVKMIHDGTIEAQTVDVTAIVDYRGRPTEGPLIVRENGEGKYEVVSGKLPEGAKTVKAVVVREEDGWTRANARAIADEANLAEGALTPAEETKARARLGEGGKIQLTERNLDRLGDGNYRQYTAIADSVNMQTLGVGWDEAQNRLIDAMPEYADEAQACAAGALVAANPELDAAEAWRLGEWAVAHEIDAGAKPVAELRALMAADDAGRTPVEMPGGELKTVNELEAAAGTSAEVSAPAEVSRPETGGTQDLGRTQDRSLELTAKPDETGVFTTARFPELKIRAGEGGFRIDGLTPQLMLDRRNRHDMGRFLDELADKAEAAGLTVDLGDPALMEVADELVENYLNDKRETALEERTRGVIEILKKSKLADVTCDQAEFDQVLAKYPEGQKFIADGKTWGFFDGRKVYLNESVLGTGIGLTTPIHEFGHAAFSALKKVNPAMAARILDLMPQTKYYQDLKASADYAGHSEDSIREECFQRLLEDWYNAGAQERVPAKIYKEIDELVRKFAEQFGRETLGIRDFTPAMMATWTVDDYVQAVGGEMLSGRAFGEKRAAEFQTKTFASPAKAVEEFLQGADVGAVGGAMELSAPRFEPGKAATKPVKNLKGPDAIKAMGMIASRDGSRTALQHVAVQGGDMVVSDGRAMLIAKAPKGLKPGCYHYKTGAEGRAVDYPNWRMAADSIKHLDLHVAGTIGNGDRFMETVAFAAGLARRSTARGKQTFIDLDERYTVNPILLKNVAEAMFKLGAKELTLSIDKEAGHPVVLTGKNAQGKMTGILMPVRNTYGTENAIHVKLDNQVSFSRAIVRGKEIAVAADIEAMAKINAKDPDSIEKYLLDHLEANIEMLTGGTASITKESAKHFAWSKVRGFDGRQMRQARAKSATVIRDLIEMFSANEKTKEAPKPGKSGVAWRCRLPIAIPKLDADRNVVGAVGYDADVVIKDEGNGKFFYDISHLKKNEALTGQLIKQKDELFGAQGTTLLPSRAGFASGASDGGIISNSGAKSQGESFKFSRPITPAEDAEYADAVKRGDKDTYIRLLKSAAARRGYATPHYFDTHSAPAPAYVEGGKKNFRNLEELRRVHEEDGGDLNLFAMANGISSVPDDYLTRQGLKYYGQEVYGAAAHESLDALLPAVESIRKQMLQAGEVSDMPKVRVYRAVPKTVKEGSLQSEGQWVSPSKTYVKRHGEHRFGHGQYRIIEQEVGADELWFDGNAITEWGFDDGTANVYKNTRHNRKLLEPTYDDAGNLIPLSQRFNDRNADLRFARAGEGERKSRFVAGKVRVADDAGMGEQLPGILAASKELADGPRPFMKILGARRRIALPLSELEWLRKKLTGDLGDAVVGRKTLARGKRLAIDADVFGLVDKSDMAKAKADLKGEGLFAHEDPMWAATHGREEVRAMRERSENALADRLGELADKRAQGLEVGGQAAARGVFADGLAKILMRLKAGDSMPEGVRRLRSIGTLIKERTVGLEDELRSVASEFYDMPTKEGEEPDLDGWRQLATGAYLIAPERMAELAPKVTFAIEETLVSNAKIKEAFEEVFARQEKGAGAAVVEKIRQEQSREHDRLVKELKAMATEPIERQGWKKQFQEALLVGLHDKMAPVMLRTDDSARIYEQARKAALKAARTPAERQAITAELDRFTHGYETARRKFLLARGAYERGAWNADSVYLYKMLELENNAHERWHLKEDDISKFMLLERTIELKGRAVAHGLSVRQAQEQLERMREADPEYYARLDEYSNKFHAIIQEEVVENDAFRRMFGDAFMDCLATQTKYVTMRSTLNAEQAAWYRERLQEAGVDVRDDIYEMLSKWTARRGGGSDGGDFTAALKGSMTAKAEVRGATMEKHLRAFRSVRRNDYILAMRDLLLSTGAEGVRVLPRDNYDKTSRYGFVNFMEGGKKYTLQVPRQIADGMEREHFKGAEGIRKFHGICRALFIDYNPGYWLNNINRNASSIEKNMPGMNETWLKTVMRATFPGMTPLSELATQAIARRLSEGSLAHKTMTALLGKHTVVAYIPHAKRIAEYIMDQEAWQRKLWAAEEADDRDAVQQLLTDREEAWEMMRGNLFVTGAAGHGDVESSQIEEIFGKRGLKTMEQRRREELADKQTGGIIRKAGRLAAKPFKLNQRQQEYEDVLAKAIGYLNDRLQFGDAHAPAESAMLAGDKVSIKRGERSGSATPFIQLAFSQFFNQIEKGTVAFYNNFGDKATRGEAIGKTARVMLSGLVGKLIMMGVFKQLLMQLVDGDEDKAKEKFGALYDYASFAPKAYANVSDYLRGNYDTVPIMMVGDYTTVSLGLARSDEDKLILGWSDVAAKMLAHQMGLGPKVDALGAVADLTMRGMVPDFQGATPSMALARDVVEAMLHNPTDLFRGAKKFDNDVYALRTESLEMAGKYLWQMAANVWNDLGGRMVLEPEVGGRGTPAPDQMEDEPVKSKIAEHLHVALAKLPVLGPAMKRFIKVSVGNPLKHEAGLVDEDSRKMSLVRILKQDALKECKRLGGYWGAVDPDGYTKWLEEKKAQYGLEDYYAAKLEADIWNECHNTRADEIERKEGRIETLRYRLER